MVIPDSKNPLYKKSLCKTCRQPLPKQLELENTKLTQDQIDEFSECFQMFDKDGDGTIDTKELGAVLRSLGNNPSEDDVLEMIDEADEDGSGSINFPEFIALMLKKQQSGESKEELRQVFRVFDKDGNGFVSTSELKFVMSRMGVHFTDDELNEMVMEADINGDGQVCFEEFYAIMTTD